METNISKELVREHQLIKTILRLTRELVANAYQISDEQLYKTSGELVKFVEEFVDDYHHSKEENILFAELSEPGVLQHCNPIGQMLYEHETGREHLNGIKSAITKKCIEALKISLIGYCDLLEQHIFKEDNILYPMAENNLTGERKQAIQLAYRQLEKS
ncbi:MAG: hemerythrin domain-containing protein, partial [Kangiellaceae bacterium]|nr:hemerythrin domain-containing protein [Kangiellaceae bacterium]